MKEKTLKELILENPELPLVIEVCEDDCDFDENSCNIFFNNSAYLTNYYSYPDVYDDTILYYKDDIDDIEDYYQEWLKDIDEFRNLPKEKYDKAVKDYMKQNVKEFNAIAIRAGN